MRIVERIIIATILLLTALLFVPESASTVHYFSPDTLQSTYKRQQRLSLIDLASKPRPKEAKLVEFLVTKGYWSPRETAKPKWLCTGHFSRQWRDGQSRLHSELYWRDDEWIAWSEQYPEFAKRLWKVVLERLRQGQRQGMSEAMELLWQVRSASSEKELEQILAST